MDREAGLYPGLPAYRRYHQRQARLLHTISQPRQGLEFPQRDLPQKFLANIRSKPFQQMDLLLEHLDAL